MAHTGHRLRRFRHPRRLALAAVLASALAAAASCSLAEADLDFPRVCFTLGGIAVPGLSTGSGSVTAPFTLDLSSVPLLQADRITPSTLLVEQVTLAPTSGAPDLSGIASAVLRLPAAAGAKELARFTGGGAPAAIVMQGTGVDVASQLTSGRLALEVTLTGTPPSTAWTASLETCVRGTTHVSY